MAKGTVKVKDLKRVLQKAGIGKEETKKVMENLVGKDRLPSISKKQIRQMKIDLLMHRVCGLSFRRKNRNVHRINPKRIRLRDGRIKTLKTIHKKRWK